MVSGPTSKPRGRPRKEDAKPRDNATRFPPNFVELCAARYKAVKSPDHSATACAGSEASDADTLGDSLFSSDPVAAKKAYGLWAAKRPTKALAAVKAATWGDAADHLADYARDYARNVGISLHFAIADAVATCAERGTFVTCNGLAVSFERAMRRVYYAMNCDWRETVGIGDTGGTLYVKPARPGSLVLQPDRDMRPLAPEGEVVADSRFWRMCLLHGDVTLIQPSTETRKNNSGERI